MVQQNQQPLEKARQYLKRTKEDIQKAQQQVEQQLQNTPQDNPGDQHLLKEKRKDLLEWFELLERQHIAAMTLPKDVPQFLAQQKIDRNTLQLKQAQQALQKYIFKRQQYVHDQQPKPSLPLLQLQQEVIRQLQAQEIAIKERDPSKTEVTQFLGDLNAERLKFLANYAQQARQLQQQQAEQLRIQQQQQQQAHLHAQQYTSAEQQQRQREEQIRIFDERQKEQQQQKYQQQYQQALQQRQEAQRQEAQQQGIAPSLKLPQTG